MFFMILVTSLAGLVAIGYILRELRMQRLGRHRLRGGDGEGVDGMDTMRALEMLEQRVTGRKKRDGV